MITPFIRFTESLFPCINPYVANEASRAVSQFAENYGKDNFYARSEISGLAQGDIVDRLPFVSYDDEGNTLENILPGMILSQSCDIDNRDYLVIAPLIDMENFGDAFQASIKNNITFNMFYLPDYSKKEQVIDFSLANSFNTKCIKELVEAKRIKVLKSLNQLGFYVLICKLTVFLLRPEDEETQSLRTYNK